MTELPLKQFVPSKVCLKCDGCCRYKTADSPWRPKLGARDCEGLGALITAGNAMDGQSYVKTAPSCGQHICMFLEEKDNTCGIYSRRPLECFLYPFILSKTADALKVYVHLACPYIQDHLSRPDYEAYVLYLREFFRREDVRRVLAQNSAMLHDYTAYTPELLRLFDLTSL